MGRPQITQITQISEALCETCLERGRKRRADVVMEDLAMCFDCYRGKPFRRAEEAGGDDPARRARQRRYGQRHMDQLRERQKKWRAENSESVRKYQRRYRTDEELSRLMLEG